MYKDMTIRKQSVFVLLVLCSIVSSLYPIVIQAVNVCLSCGFILVIFVRYHFGYSLAAVAMYSISTWLVGSFEFSPLYPSAGLLLFQLFVVKLLQKIIKSHSVTDVVLIHFYVLIFAIGLVTFGREKQIESTLLSLSALFNETLYCLVVFQIVDKSLIYLNFKFEFYPDALRPRLELQELAQSVVSFAFCAVLAASAIVSLQDVEQSMLLAAERATQERFPEHSESFRLGALEEIAKETDSIRLLTIGSNGLVIDANVSKSIEDAARKLSLYERKSWVLLAPEFNENKAWILVARFMLDKIIIYEFNSLQEMNSFFTTDTTDVYAARMDSNVALVTDYLKLLDSESGRRGEKLYIAENDLLVIWGRSDTENGWLSDVRQLRPSDTYLTYTVPSTLSEYEAWTFITTVPAWEFVIGAYSEFTEQCIIGFLMLMAVVSITRILFRLSLKPLNGFLDSVRDVAKDVKSLHDFSTPQPTVNILSEANDVRESFEYLFNAIRELRKALEGALGTYEHLVNSMPIGVLAIDSSGSTVFSNEALADICKLRVNALSELRKYTRDMQYAGPAGEVEITPLLAGDGSTREVAVKKVRRIGISGFDDGYWVIAVDLTDEKIRDAQLAQASKLATLGQMSTEIAHELNQPLNVIAICQANISRLLSQPEIDRSKVYEKMSRMKLSVDRASRMINHMRTYGRVDTGKLSLIDAREAIVGALTLTADQLKLNGVKVTTDIAEESLLILGDEARLEQVILNLISNSKDATSKLEKPARVHISAGSSSGLVTICVSDNGGGVPEADLFKIFEPFYTTKLVGEGTGLGGSISYGIIKEMGGKIVAENVGDGLKVTITLGEHNNVRELSRSSSASA